MSPSGTKLPPQPFGRFGSDSAQSQLQKQLAGGRAAQLEECSYEVSLFSFRSDREGADQKRHRHTEQRRIAIIRLAPIDL